MSDVSKLIKDLNNVPSIIGGLGLSIAAAQKAMNADYLDGLERVVAITRSLLGGADGDKKNNVDEFRTFVQDMIAAAAPARYQFTETTLTVKMDLAQSMDLAGSVGLGVGFGAVSVNAAMTVGYGYDYRAAAECRTVLQAAPPSAEALGKLFDRAAAINDKALVLPDRSPVDQAILDKQAAIFEKLTGIKPA
jgi:hypothetical protein